MSYSPTMYSASIFTPRALAFLASARDGIADLSASILIHPARHAGVFIKVFHQSRRAVSIQVFDERAVADADLLLLQERRHRNDDGELLRIAFIVVGHRHDSLITVA